jgi:hypothetical protein
MVNESIGDPGGISREMALYNFFISAPKVNRISELKKGTV